MHWSGYDASKKMKIDQTLRSGLFEFDLYQMSHGASPVRTNSPQPLQTWRVAVLSCRWARDGARDEGGMGGGREPQRARQCCRVAPLRPYAPART